VGSPVNETAPEQRPDQGTRVPRAVGRDELTRPLASLDEALEIVAGEARPRPAVTLPATDAVGLVVADAVVAGVDVPGYLASAMDGYAVLAADCADASDEHPSRLDVTGSIRAGGAIRSFRAGQAVKIMTGGQLPDGADAVVPWEDTDLGAAAVGVRRSVKPGANVRPPDDEIQRGQSLLGAGAVLTPLRAAALAAIGTTHVRVVPRPRVAIVTTGDELVPAGAVLAPGQVHDSNGPFLAAFARQFGGEVVRQHHAGDDRTATERVLVEAATEVDVMVTTGGVSVGEHDWVRDVFEAVGTIAFWRVAMKPGKPVAFGHIASTPVLALPGNPNGVVVGSYLFLSRLLFGIAGRENEGIRVHCAMTDAIRGDAKRTSVVPVQVADGRATPLPRAHRAGLGDLVNAEGFAIVPPGGCAAGSLVAVEMCDPGRRA
jgi:molybdopterin molybdotransferase